MYGLSDEEAATLERRLYADWFCQVQIGDRDDAFAHQVEHVSFFVDVEAVVLAGKNLNLRDVVLLVGYFFGHFYKVFFIDFIVCGYFENVGTHRRDREESVLVDAGVDHLSDEDVGEDMDDSQTLVFAFDEHEGVRPVAQQVIILRDLVRSDPSDGLEVVDHDVAGGDQLEADLADLYLDDPHWEVWDVSSDEEYVGSLRLVHRNYLEVRLFDFKVFHRLGEFEGAELLLFEFVRSEDVVGFLHDCETHDLFGLGDQQQYEGVQLIQLHFGRIPEVVDDGAVVQVAD